MKKIQDEWKDSNLIGSELRQIIREVVQELLWDLEAHLPDPDAGLELKPAVAERLKKVLETPIEEIPTISHEEMLRELELKG